MSGTLRKPGLLTVEYLGEDEPRTYEVRSGPWVYAQQLCWTPADGGPTKYAPLENVATYQKHDQEGSSPS